MKCDIEKCKAWCCRFIFIGPIAPGMQEYWRLHGAKLIKSRLAVPCRCTALDENNRCTIYDKRPEFCKRWHCEQLKN